MTIHAEGREGSAIIKKILIGTTNPSKVRRFQLLLSEYDVEFYTLQDLGIIDEPQEEGRTPEENAILKAAFYGNFFDTVICNDEGLYFDELGLEDERQPGLKVRTPGGCERLNDEEMIAFYSKLVRSLGGRVQAYYLDGIAVYHKNQVFSFMEEREAARKSAFYMLDQPSEKRTAGWPLDSLSVDRETLTYFVEMGNEDENTQDEEIIADKYKERLIDFFVSSLEL